jgi:hypothetical protein
MKISFDFDGTLSQIGIQKFCFDLIQKGYDIWITTSRVKEFTGAIHYHDDLMLVANSLGIPEERIHFTNSEFKAEYLENNNFVLHIDDDPFELIEIDKTKVIGIYVLDKQWKEKVLDVIGEVHD